MHAKQIGAFVEDQRIDAVVIALAGGLPLFSDIRNAVRVWYAADDQILHSWFYAELERSENMEKDS